MHQVVVFDKRGSMHWYFTVYDDAAVFAQRATKAKGVIRVELTDADGVVRWKSPVAHTTESLLAAIRALPQEDQDEIKRQIQALRNTVS